MTCVCQLSIECHFCILFSSGFVAVRVTSVPVTFKTYTSLQFKTSSLSQIIRSNHDLMLITSDMCLITEYKASCKDVVTFMFCNCSCNLSFCHDFSVHMNKIRNIVTSANHYINVSFVEGDEQHAFTNCL